MMALIFALIFVFFPGIAGTQELTGDTGELFRFEHRTGDVYHADARVRESVVTNGFRSHVAEISESSVARVYDVDADGGAVLDMVFRTEERIDGLPGYIEWTSEERVRLQRSSLGELAVPADASRPILRNLPVFPDHRLQPGDTWTAEGEEVHLFRIDGFLYGPYSGRFPVAYEYLGDTVDGDTRLARIGIEYSMHIPVREPGEPVRMVSGSSSQVLYWDLNAGGPHSKRELFDFFLLRNDGSSQEFRGEQEVIYRRSRVLDRGEAVPRLTRELESLPFVKVLPDQTGIRIILEDEHRILFPPESALISPEQQARLGALKETLKQFDDRDVVISGHTADYGDEAGRRRLSTERAAAVADLLFPGGRVGPGRLFLRGMGASEPTGNDVQDRRVEILILD